MNLRVKNVHNVYEFGGGKRVHDVYPLDGGRQFILSKQLRCHINSLR